jgi:hypothetical protein
MKRCSTIGSCLLLGLSLFAFEFTERVLAGEPLPDASVVAYRGTRPPKQPAQPKVSEVTLNGVINEVQANGLTIKAGKTSRSRDQKQWLVMAQSATTEFTIRGMATVDYLRRGQNVEFSGQIEKVADKANEEKTADKVKELTIFSRKSEALAAKKGGAKDRAADSNVAGGRIEAPKPDKDSEPTLSAPDNTKPEAGNEGESTVAASGPKTKIVGRIASYDEKGLTVTAGQRTIHVDLAAIPTINVDLSLSDPKVVPDTKDKSKSRIEGKGSSAHLFPLLVSDLVGSKILVNGMAAETKTASQCAATRIDVTLAKPLTGTKKSASAARKTADDK